MRPTADYSPSVWGDHFLSCLPTLTTGGSHSHKHVQSMKEKVRTVLQSNVEKPSQKLKLIDNIQRLGVSYHFQSEIEEILKDMHKSPPYYNSDKDVDGNLSTIALWFRLLRQQGYNISSDIFEKFKDDKGDFKVALIPDILGLLNFYEASNLRIHGEDILDQALAFTTFHLKSSLSEMNPNFKEKITHALSCPFRKGIPRMEARYYISVYSKEVPPNDLLLQFATLDFNILQAQHQKELSHLTEWWKKLDVAKTVPFVRDRITEGFFWPLGVYFEPQYTIGRRIGGKLIAILTAIDDTYDAYAKLKELVPFTEAIQRWDMSPIDSLPKCMKIVFEELLELFNEMELLTAEEGRSCFVQYVKREVQKLAQAYLVEAKWREERYIPTYDEYMKNGIITSCYPTLEAASFLGLGHIASREVFDWISNNDIPKIVRASSIICRLTDDKASHRDKELENAWKDINEECLKPNTIPMPVLECVVNFSRIIELVYGNFQDKYTHGELLKDHVAALLADPIGLVEQYK